MTTASFLLPSLMHPTHAVPHWAHILASCRSKTRLPIRWTWVFPEAMLLGRVCKVNDSSGLATNSWRPDRIHRPLVNMYDTADTFYRMVYEAVLLTTNVICKNILWLELFCDKSVSLYLALGTYVCFSLNSETSLCHGCKWWQTPRWHLIILAPWVAQLHWL